MWTKAQYALFLTAAWAYTVVWIGAIVLLPLSDLPMWKWVLVAALMLAAPSLAELFTSYDGYRKWYVAHVIADERTQQ